jgi:hypothetical protein
MLLVDFKLEFGVFHDRIVLGDEFSPDGCRLWDKETRKKLDKDRFRQGLGDVVEAYEEVGHRLGIDFNWMEIDLNGEVAERLNVPDSKSGVGASLPRVRIPPSPPKNIKNL